MFRSCLFYWYTGCLGILLTACATDYENLPAYTVKKQLQAVIEIPAGTNQPITYNPTTREFQNETARIIRFLPYPGNFGFIPSTKMDHIRGGDDRPLDILVLAESQPSGTVLEVMPLGIILLERDGLLDPKVIAVPAQPSRQLITATDYNSFTRDYPVIKNIITQWFVHANPSQKVRLIGWKNEQFTEEYIRRWLK